MYEWDIRQLQNYNLSILFAVCLRFACIVFKSTGTKENKRSTIVQRSKILMVGDGLILLQKELARSVTLRSMKRGN